MDALIVGSPRDHHISRISELLKRDGFDVFVWNPASSPMDSLVTADIGNKTVVVEDESGEHLISSAKLIWFRRLLNCTQPSQLAPSAEKAWEIEMRLNQIALLASLNECGGLWINDFHAARYSQIKSVQLLVGAQSGFAIPSTIFSNDPARIRCLQDYSKFGIVNKCHHQAEFSGKFKRAGANIVPGLSGVQAESLKIMPGIYQDVVADHIEHRVFVMGDEIVSAAIQKSHMKGVDARDGLLGPGCIRPSQLPAHAKEMCLDLMRRLNLRSASLDLLELDGGEWALLDVNQAGNFLWMNDLAPELGLERLFVQFVGKSISSMTKN